MKKIFVVKQEEADLARKMEKKLLGLSEASGILFVGVSVIPDPIAESRIPLYKVVVGCSRERDPKLADAIIKYYLAAEIDDNENQLVVEVHRGVTKETIK